jgi:CRP-like cAMP-binding protein
MSKERWALLESIQERLNSLSDLPPETMVAIADHLEEAISASSRAPLEALSTQLVELFSKLLRVAPPAAINAVRGSTSADSAEHVAYMLGQVSFAQLVAAQAAEHRADDGFLDVIRDHRYKNYIAAFSRQDHTGVELAGITGECAETVSRKLKRLRELGITDFRREGTRLVNFLTPAARAVIEEPERFAREDAVPVASKKDKLAGLLESLPASMRRLPTFGTPNTFH